MSDLALTQTALNGARTEGLAVEIADLGLVGMVSLRGDLASPALAAAVKHATGCDLPGIRKAVFAGREQGALWMAPDEVLLFVPYAQADAKAAAIADAMSGEHHLALNASDARAVIRLTGDDARAVIAKGAPIDLARGQFGVGDFRRSRLGQVAMGVYQRSDGPDVFEIIVFRSVAQYVFDWLAASAKPGTMPTLG